MTTFGRYRLTERLGVGGMAQVFRAVVDGPDGFSRSLVVKRILPELSDNADFVRLLVDEARLSALLHHPGIVQVYELGQAEGEYYLAMEYVDGRDLASLLEQLGGRAMPASLACFLVNEVAAALDYAHALTDAGGRALEIIHRDISPSNILVGKTGVVKLLDFGIAKAAHGIRNEKTRTGVVKGKISYMSPEQADARAIDRRSDIFSLGIVFWECLTSRRLFRGTDDLHTLRLVREAEIDPPSSVVEGVHPRVEAVVMKMLAPRREDRYATCGEVRAALSPLVHESRADARALERFLAELGTSPLRGPAVASDVLTVVAKDRPRATEEHAPPKRRWPLAAVLVLALAGAGALALLARNAPKAEIAPTAPPPIVALPPPVSPAPIAVAPSPPLVAPVVKAPTPVVAVARPPAHKPHHTSRKRPARSGEIHDPFSER